MAVTKTTVVQIGPEFASIPDDARLAQLIAWAGNDVNTNIWKEKTDRGIALLVCHMLKITDPSITGSGGPITQEKVGDLSRSYGTYDLSGSEELGQTSYGREFLRVRKTLIISPWVVC